MNREVYLDNSATTKPYPEVVEGMVEMLVNHYGNPSSLHMKGIEAENAIKKARESIAKALDVKSGEIFFASGGTEANNMAIRGCALANKKRGNHLVTSTIEHPSVLNTFKFLEQEGYRVSYIGVDRYGRVNLKQLENEISDQTILVSMMYVNNEVGTIQPLQEIRNIIDSKKSKALYHVDAIQSFGKILFTPAQYGIDLLSLSAHKLHGPKGAGALYVRKGVRIHPIVFGGSQEFDMRSGTENVAGIVGFGKAAEITFDNFNHGVSVMDENKKYLEEKIKETMDHVVINGRCDGQNAPHILNVSFLGIKAEVLLHALEAKGIFVSTGSACSSNKPSPSHVLAAMGIEKPRIESAVRFSFSSFNTKEDVDYCVEQLAAIIKQLRKYVRR